MARVFYKFFALLVVLILLIRIVLGFYLTTPKTIQLAALPKKILDWVISSDESKFESSSITLIIDNDNYSDRLVLQNAKIYDVLDKKEYANIEEIQVRFSARDLLNKFGTGIDLVISKSYLELRNKENTKELKLDSIFEYFVTLFEKGTWDFKTIAVIDLTADFVSQKGKSEIIKIASSQISVKENENQINGKIFYDFKNSRHVFDLIASYENGRYFSIYTSFENFPLHLMLQRSNSGLFQDFANEKNYFEVSGNIKHNFDRHLERSSNSFTLSNAKGQIYFHDSDSLSFNISKMSGNLDVTDNRILAQDLYLELGKNHSFSCNLSIRDNEIEYTKLKLDNFPVEIYKLMRNIDVLQGVYNFLNYGNGTKGYISGDVDLVLKNDFLIQQKFVESYINTKLELNDVTYYYDDLYLPVENAKAICSIQNNDAELKIISAKIGHSSIQKGEIRFYPLDLPKMQNVLEIKAVTEGEGRDLVSFIPRNVLNDLKKYAIDLEKIESVAKTDIKISIPLAAGVENLYEIKSKISDLSLDLLNDNIILDHMHIDAQFNGKSVILEGVGKINGQNSRILYKLDENYESLFNVRMHIASNNHPHNSIIEVIEGEADLNFKLFSRAGKWKHNTSADLSKIGFSIPTIGLQKQTGIKAKLDFSGYLGSRNSSNLKLIAENLIRLDSKISFLDDGFEISAQHMQFGDTNLKLKYFVDDKKSKIDIDAECLDMSQMNLEKWINKSEISNKQNNSKIFDANISANLVKLKNNIFLTNLRIVGLSNQTQYTYAELKANITEDKDKYLHILLKKDNPTQDKWIINTNQLGDVVSGLGVSNTIDGGDMHMVLYMTKDPNIPEKKPIINGTVRIKDMTMLNNNIALKMISFLSFPGLTTRILNKNIPLNLVESKFEYKDQILKIYNGSANGSVCDFTFQGSLDHNKREYMIKGIIIPSLFGVNGLVNWVLSNAPGVSQFLSYGKRKGLFIAPYKISEKY